MEKGKKKKRNNRENFKFVFIMIIVIVILLFVIIIFIRCIIFFVYRWIFLEILDKVFLGIVNWKIVSKLLIKMLFRKVENCN